MAMTGPWQTDFGNTRIFAWLERSVRNAFSAGGSVAQDVVMPYCYDCTDGAGHGVLVATDNIYITMNTNGWQGAANADFKILYRFKEVSLVEYIGIVQSQQ